MFDARGNSLQAIWPFRDEYFFPSVLIHIQEDNRRPFHQFTFKVKVALRRRRTDQQQEMKRCVIGIAVVLLLPATFLFAFWVGEEMKRTAVPSKSSDDANLLIFQRTVNKAFQSIKSTDNNRTFVALFSQSHAVPYHKPRLKRIQRSDNFSVTTDIAETAGQKAC